MSIIISNFRVQGDILKVFFCPTKNKKSKTEKRRKHFSVTRITEYFRTNRELTWDGYFSFISLNNDLED